MRKAHTKKKNEIPQLTSGNFSEHFRIVKVDENELVINYGSPRNYYFQRIEKLPQECSSMEENLDIDPIKNFDILWKLFDDNYAFFEHRNIDWDQVKLNYTPKIKNVKTQQEFYQLIKNLLDSLKDGHVKINVPDSLKMQRDNNEISFETIKNEIPGAILENYVGSPQTYNYGTISWGTLRNTNIGYIIVSRMYGFPDYGLSEQDFNKKINEVFLADSGPGYQYYMDEIKGVESAMEKIYADLSETDSIIFDLRFNEGGMSGPSMKLLSHFIQKPYTAIIKTIETNTVEPIRQEICIEPAKENLFNQKVCLLTSHWTASASEIFALSSMPSQNFSRYGSETAGVLSEIVFGVLPNGWEVSMSVDIISDVAGTIYEVTGVPVDYSMGYPEDEMRFYDSFFSDGQFRDPLIEKFLK